MKSNVDYLADRLPALDAYERIICEDGSIDGSLQKWDRHMKRRNDFIIRSNDLHEIRSYTRAIQLARGDLICLLQDDGQIPINERWVPSVIELFEEYPGLAMLGGEFNPFGLGQIHGSEHDSLSEGGSIPPASEWSYDRDGPFPSANGSPVRTVDPETRIPLVFVPSVALGPVFLRAEVFDELGGFDRDFSDPGKPGIGYCDDYAYRCWENGYKVAYSDMSATQHDVGASLLYDPETRWEQSKINKAKCQEKHEDMFPEIESRVVAANSALIEPDPDEEINTLY